MPDLSIIILSYKSQDKLRVTLRSVFASNKNIAAGPAKTYSYEVIVVDNDSGDGTAEMVEREFPQAKLLRNANNGFSKGNNLGIGQSHGRTVLLLNPDTELEANTLAESLAFVDAHPEIGILGCKVIKGDGSLDLACRRKFPNPVNAFFRLFGLAKLFPRSKFVSSYNLTHMSEDQPGEVDSVMGAFLMIKRQVIERIGLLDEQFFMYGEDLDWCWRAKEAGYQVYYFPSVTCYHYKGSSSRKAPRLALCAFYDAMWIFYGKHYAQNYWFMFNWLVWFGIKLRYGLALLANTVRKQKYVSK